MSTSCVPHREAGWFRLITDFRPLNAACTDLPVALDDVCHLRHLFGQKIDSLASIDIKDGYYHFKLCESMQNLFARHIQGEFF